MVGIRTAVIDDHSLFREGVISMLEKSGRIEIVGEGATADEAVEIACACAPDIMLVDVSMPGGGIAAARAISTARPEVKVVMLTISETRDDVMSAFEAGARGYLLKGIVRSELIGMLDAAYRGEIVISPSLGARLLTRLKVERQPEADDPVETLTGRQKQVLQLVSRGLTNKEIANALDLSDRTVKNYMTIIMDKLNVRNRVEVALKMRKSSPDQP